MPGHLIEAECECGWKREELRPGATWSEAEGYVLRVMAYENGDLHTVDAKHAEAEKLEVLEDPFLNTKESMEDRAYRCPSCGRKNLKLLEVGLWD
jgi:C4-type Zn-finger protein